MAQPWRRRGWTRNTFEVEIIHWFGKKSGESEVRAGLPEVYPRLWRFCLTLTRDRAAADDLAQRTCVQALQSADRFEPGTHLARWLFTIARRIWLNQIRADKVRRGNGVVPVEEIDLPDKKNNNEANIFAREVFDLIQALPEGQRSAMVLVYVEGYSYREAAEILEIPTGTVMSRLAAARRKIASKVEAIEVTE